MSNEMEIEIEIEPDAYQYDRTDDDILCPITTDSEIEAKKLGDKYQALYSAETIQNIEAAYVEIKCQECSEVRTVKQANELDEDEVVRVRCSGCSFINEVETVTEHRVVGHLVRKEVFSQ